MSQNSLAVVPKDEEGNANNETVIRQRRKRMRRLAYDNAFDASSNLQKPGSFAKRLVIGASTILLVAAVLFGHYYTLKYSNKTNKIFNNFLKTYRKHYNQIIHGMPDYCEQELTGALFKEIRKQNLLNQDEALLQLELAMRNDTKFNAIALVGPPGVGKSFLVRLLAQYFPWRDNVHTYAWNTFVNDEAEKFRLIHLFVDKLSDCGKNLLIIDNLTPCEREVVSILNRIFTQGYENDAELDKQVIILYIFNMNTMELESRYTEQEKALRNLPNTTTIFFQPFGADEVKDCIELNLALENMTLTEDEVDDIVLSIDPTRSGCKNVHAKVMSYGHKVPDIEAVDDKKGEKNPLL